MDVVIIYNAICIVIVCPNLSVYKVLHFSPALFSHVTVDLKKQLVLVLNKVVLILCMHFLK